MTKMLMFLTTILLGSLAHAQTIEIGDVHSGGTGCPDGTVQVHENPNGPERLLLVSDFKARSGGSTGKRMDRKSCMIAIPVTVPAGYSVALEGELIGTQRTSKSGQGTLNHEFFFTGGVGNRVSESFVPGTAGRFSTTSGQTEWSPCGSSVNLRANLSLFTQGSARAQVEAIVLKVIWRQCN